MKFRKKEGVAMKRQVTGIYIMVWAGILLMVLTWPRATGATGPRLTPKLFESDDTIKIFVYEYPPLTSFEMPNMGLCSEIVVAAFKEAGVQVTIENQVVKNLAIYSLIQDNEAAMIGDKNDFSEEQLKQLVLMPCFIMRGAYFYYKPKHRKELTWSGKLDNLKGYTYGALIGEDVTIYEKAGIPTVTGEIASLFKLLKAEKIDFLGVADIRGEWFINKYYQKEKNDFAKMKGLAWEAPFSIIFNKKNARSQEISRAFAEGFQQIQKNGNYEELLEKYGKKW